MFMIKNELEMIFFNKNAFAYHIYYKNTFANYFTIKMREEWFL